MKRALIAKMISSINSLKIFYIFIDFTIRRLKQPSKRQYFVLFIEEIP